MRQEPLFSVQDLRVSFGRHGHQFEAVRGINLHVDHGEVLGIVGESGSGKSVGMLAALGLQAKTAQVRGSAKFRGRELVGMPRRELRTLRGSRIGMIFQDPLSSLNPVMTVGAQIAETILLHNSAVSKKAALDRAVELLALVAISQPDRRIHQFPHEFSGGMRQRVMIAMAVANDPDLLIADEPTTALDVTVQAQIMDVLGDLKKRLNLGLILITHDLGVLAGHADRVAVVYSGEVVEQAGIDDLFERPSHPYTRGLIASIPDMSEEKDRLFSIEGAPPPLGRLPGGCAFHPRCPQVQPICRTAAPVLRTYEGHSASCHFADIPAEGAA
ncbi:oligopeptide/dipeptide ABC transporter ATP-binding protein [Angulomicrobium tetraedrale]|uniref:Oligopeptide/dipeptide ABC transporter ATP-binding protein n=2 Tax=Ancylobacter tetraedralis TaxID=217068 RepID=A0A839ZDM2_9HYPH|nr:ABC transporter ATP-binding protein [Ancylobacter tetraedralis]MBB3772777.1 oligopeptide/dipeptide ABC transporter ATP-binding protein [Ancylobacter tetraedralis]